MDQGIYIALSGAKLQELRLENISNNLANANTSGYKADTVTSRSFQFELEDLLSDIDNFRDIKSVADLDQPDPFGSYNGIYSKTVQVNTDFSQGFLKFTGNPLDVALDGPGFIAVETPQGTRYTRHGSLKLNNDGELVSTDGFKIRGKGLKDLGEGDISIDNEGNVFVDGKKEGTIDIVEFANQHILRKEGHNLMVSKVQGDFEQKPENTMIKQGHLEQPNMQVVKEMVKMIEVNRLYETYQKNIISVDESTRKLLTI